MMKTQERLQKGTKVSFVPDEELFGKYRFLNEYIEKGFGIIVAQSRINNNLQW